MRILFVRFLAAMLAAAALWLAWVVVVPVSLPATPYNVTVGPNRTLSQVARVLENDGVIRNRWVMVALSRMTGADRKVKAGLYEFSSPVAMWEILKRLAEGSPDQPSVTVIEGWTFRQFRQALARERGLEQVSAAWDEARIMAEMGATGQAAEGMFFPSTYFYTPGTSDIEVLRRAYRTMQQNLESAWNSRQTGIPYGSPYELLTMASLIEKETSKDSDRPMVSSVFANRLKIGMRLQTDPSVIYGMGERYQGRIGKEGLRRDTPYNTYTRGGLPPTPISLPGMAALQAAAHPVESRALYFVAKGKGESHFSETLDEHNAAVRQYILKKGS
ncbi:endolytic transglycosylase MltG [Craterilacuibacter sp.]|uniref:endolytic transglycosylase MltG n=1 Tax=Craterilacuibacter sp. TaxID=2870909 RepID=UPI003F38BA6E